MRGGGGGGEVVVNKHTHTHIRVRGTRRHRLPSPTQIRVTDYIQSNIRQEEAV